jgi:hypothetical protein
MAQALIRSVATALITAFEANRGICFEQVLGEKVRVAYAAA